jgi:ATP-dependent phosphofructokinase / diphosphate-dependent phosphofructokinase
MPRFNALYAQSGGVTAVINASAAGVIEAWRSAARRNASLGKLYAGRNGIVGVLAEDLIDTTRESDAAIAALRHLPGGAFGSCRFKLGDPSKPDGKGAAQFDRLLEVFRAHGIRYFFYNGGGDSADTCLKVAQLATARGYPLQAIHVPKTIDNDLPLTDTCPGFGSVAKYVAVSTREASLDVVSMASTSTRVFVLEVMGRHAGWIAAAAGLADTREQPLPLVILLPEVPFDEQRFLAAVKAKVEAHGYCTVVASEGTQTADGKFLADQGLRDAFGHAQLGGVAPVLATRVKDQLKLKVHWAVSDYLQRSARHVASATDVAQAVAVGKAGVQLAMKGRNQVMATIERVSDRPYKWRVGAVPLDEVANVERKMPGTFISADGYGITAEARRYLLPLIQGEAKAPWRDGLPLHPTLKRVAVPKKLAAFAP